MRDPRILWIGFHLEGQKAFKSVAKQYNIVSVLSLTPNAASKRSAVIDYKTLSKTLKIPFYEIVHINDDNSIQLIRKLKPDLMIVLGWSQILGKEVLSIPIIGSIGAHASLLPEYRGSAPVNWALINGLKKTGNTLMWLDEGVDTGMVIDQKEIPITQYDSCKTVYEKVAATNEKMLLNNLKQITLHGKRGLKQPIANENYLPRRKPSDGLINFNQPACKIYDFVRALARPYPGAFFIYDDKKYIVWKAAALDNYKTELKPGVIAEHIFAFSPSCCSILVSTSEGGLLIFEVEVNGKKLTGKRLHNKFSVGVQFN